MDTAPFRLLDVRSQPHGAVAQLIHEYYSSLILPAFAGFEVRAMHACRCTKLIVV
jgi:hypothetical protein